MKTTGKDENRFEKGASRYAAYLETPEGRLRGDLALHPASCCIPAPPPTRGIHLGPRTKALL